MGMNGEPKKSDVKRAAAGTQAQILMESIGEIVARLQKAMPRFIEVIENLRPALIVTVKFLRHVRNTRVLDDIGWLPHYTMPFDGVDKCGDDADALHDLLSRHYQERWPDVRQEIEFRVTRYNIDGEAKKTFCEALDSHESGHYQSVCSLLPPAIERASRKELHNDSMEKRITSQEALRKLARKFPPSSVEPGGLFAWNLVRRLSRHFYEYINDEATQQRFAQDPVPNRHAALHGLVEYSSMQNSLNMIFMADYIFQVISLTKEALRESTLPLPVLDQLLTDHRQDKGSEGA